MTSSNGNIFRVTGPLCGEFTGPGEFPTQRPVTRSFDVFFDLRLNKRLSKQPWGWWFETPAWSLWRHRNVKSSYNGCKCSRYHRYDIRNRHTHDMECRRRNRSCRLVFMSICSAWYIQTCTFTGSLLRTKDYTHLYLNWVNSSLTGQNGRHFGRRQFQIHFLEWKR